MGEGLPLTGGAGAQGWGEGPGWQTPCLPELRLPSLASCPRAIPGCITAEPLSGSSFLRVDRGGGGHVWWVLLCPPWVCWLLLLRVLVTR